MDRKDAPAAQGLRSGETELFGVSIAGPDDLIAARDYEDAIRIAHSFNEWWLAKVRDRGQHEYDPRMWASPTTWPGEPAAHAVELARTDGEYAFFVARARGEQ